MYGVYGVYGVEGCVPVTGDLKSNPPDEESKVGGLAKRPEEEERSMDSRSGRDNLGAKLAARGGLG